MKSSSQPIDGETYAALMAGLSSPERRALKHNFTEDHMGRFWKNNTLDEATKYKIREIGRTRQRTVKLEQELLGVQEQLDAMHKQELLLNRKRQRAFKRLLCELHLAAIIIQSCWKGHKPAKHFVRHLAAKTIQRRYSAYRERCAYLAEKKKRQIEREREARYRFAKRIQNTIVRYAYKRQKAARMKARIRIQKGFRRYRARLMVQVLRNARDQLFMLGENATQIQRMVRGYLCRSWYRQGQRAATKIQSFFRGTSTYRVYRKTYIVVTLAGGSPLADKWLKQRLVRRVLEEIRLAASFENHLMSTETAVAGVITELMKSPTIMSVFGLIVPGAPVNQDPDCRQKGSLPGNPFLLANVPSVITLYPPIRRQMRNKNASKAELSEEFQKAKKAVEATLTFEIHQLLRKAKVTLRQLQPKRRFRRPKVAREAEVQKEAEQPARQTSQRNLLQGTAAIQRVGEVPGGKKNSSTSGLARASVVGRNDKEDQNLGRTTESGPNRASVVGAKRKDGSGLLVTAVASETLSHTARGSKGVVNPTVDKKSSISVQSSKKESVGAVKSSSLENITETCTPSVSTTKETAEQPVEDTRFVLDEGSAPTTGPHKETIPTASSSNAVGPTSPSKKKKSPSKKSQTTKKHLTKSGKAKAKEKPLAVTLATDANLPADAQERANFRVSLVRNNSDRKVQQ